MLFNRMRSLGKEIDDATGAFCYPHPHTLDLCMAPGGYSATVLDGHPDATIRGVSLPRSLGGYRLMVRYDRRDPRVQVRFMDITMLAAEFGVRLNDIPSHHPDASQFVSDRPFLGQDFDIVICDGQVLKEHIRGEWREYYEATRLLMSQLILGLQRIKKGGTFVMLLHKFATWYTCTLLKTFDAFSSVTLFKPESMHAKKSTFYLVAKNVQPQSGPAKEAVKEWKRVWYLATFGGDEGRGSFQEDPSEELVAAFLEEFGSRLVQLGETIWGVQTRALENAPYARKGHLGYTADVDGTPLHRWHKVPYGTSLPAGTGDNQCGGIVEDSELRGIMIGRRM
ncbi:hypothetical protein L208DRAFT_1406817 [Tricholoma matsutake]|nr:hypothetical protein L208DRAFT_1406817 [Tricholoma matsutake 945]